MFKPFCLLSIITELILLDLKYHGDSERTVHLRRIHQSSNAFLEKSSYVKYLGVYIDYHLNWHDHIDYIGSKNLAVEVHNCNTRYASSDQIAIP